MKIGAQITLAKNAFWTLLSHIMARGALMLSSIILARSFSPTDFSAYSYFLITMVVLGAYAALGLGTTASRYFAEVGYEPLGGQNKPLGSLLSISVVMSVIAGFLVLAVPESWLNADLAVPSWLLAVGVVATVLGVVPGGAILGLEQYRAATVISFFHGLLLVISALMAAALKMPILAMVAVVLGMVLQSVGQFVIIVKIVGWDRVTKGFIFGMDDLKRILSFAGPMFVVTLISGSGLWVVGRIIIEGDGGVESFSLYAIGMQWYSLALLLPGIVSRVVLPRLVRESENSVDESKLIVRSGVLLAIISGVGFLLLVVVFGSWIGEVYGDQYDIDRFFIAAYMGAALLSAPTNTFGNAIVARDGQVAWMINTTIWFAAILLTAFVANYFSLNEWVGSVAFGVSGGVLLFISYVSCRSRGLV